MWRGGGGGGGAEASGGGKGGGGDYIDNLVPPDEKVFTIFCWCYFPSHTQHPSGSFPPPPHPHTHSLPIFFKHPLMF